MARTLAEHYIEKGRVEGMVRAKQDALIELMVEKFGPVPEQIVNRVRALEDTETLDQLLKRLVHANRIEEMQL